MFDNIALLKYVPHFKKCPTRAMKIIVMVVRYNTLSSISSRCSLCKPSECERKAQLEPRHSNTSAALCQMPVTQLLLRRTLAMYGCAAPRPPDSSCTRCAARWTKVHMRGHCLSRDSATGKNSQESFFYLRTGHCWIFRSKH